jgi:hypothetical protein
MPRAKVPLLLFFTLCDIVASSFLGFLNLVKSGALRDTERRWGEPSLRNPPPGVDVEEEFIK